ncbi:hypothetical protein H4CHR_01577 [Variovorax sp. PBS-H4]|uniref:hypothetical protein n=1 Tax=Variovorax sp. PBS-H4 TaxID=434008 RepID=UPI0013169768|nr:hypothetical protein [Variovorax sp. PBS-H4]VTU25353.1 hypothetical protein H4CHR_01577 [Variovorax sp. PBS-H4]
MAKIPTGQFGYRTPQGGDITPMPRVDNQVGDALKQLGNTAVAAGGNMLEEQQREARLAADRAAQAQALTAHATIQNGLADSFDAIQADLLDGKTDKLAAEAAWKEASKKVVADNIQSVPADRQQLVTAQVQGLQGQLQNKLFDTFRKRDQQDVSASLLTYNEQMQRFAGTDPAAAVKQYHTFADQMGPAAGWTPEQIAKSKQQFTEGVTFNQFRRQGQAAMQSGSVGAIDEVQKRLAGPEGDALDPAKRNTLDQTLFGWKQSIEAREARNADKAEREQLKRFNTATDALNQGRDLVLNGAALSPDFIADLSTKAQGTGLEKDVQTLLEVQKQASGFANLSAPQRAAQLEQARGRRADPSRGFDPQDEKQLNAAQQINDRLNKRINDGEAWAAAQSVGVIREAPALTIGNADQALQVFQQRTRDIGAVEAWAGKKVSPLQPAEAEQLQKMVRSLKPDAAASLLGQIGGVVGDPERIAAVAKQLGDKDNTMGMAMLYANSKTTQGRYTAELILQGEQAIKDKIVKVDGAAESGWRAEIAKRVRGAYSNQEVENNVVEAAFKIAAAKQGDVDNAINLAAGGIVERNGGKIPLPYGMKEPEFEKRLAAITPESLLPQVSARPVNPATADRSASTSPADAFVLVGPTRMPLADFVKTLPDARLVHAGQGLYNVRAGNQLVTNERGQRITLKVSP